MSEKSILNNNLLCGVYALLAADANGCYVGSSSNITHRLHRHVQALMRNRHHAAALQQAWDGGIAFGAVVLEQCPRELLAQKEQIWMDRFAGLLNTTTNATCPSLDPAVAKKIGDANRGRKIPAVANSNRRRIGQPWAPRDRDAWRHSISVSRTGKTYGPRDPVIGQKIAAALRDRPHSDERRLAISQGRLRHYARLKAQGITERRPGRRRHE